MSKRFCAWGRWVALSLLALFAMLSTVDARLHSQPDMVACASSDRLYDLSERHEPQHEAVLHDYSLPQRVCSSRPQRLLPSGGGWPHSPAVHLSHSPFVPTHIPFATRLVRLLTKRAGCVAAVRLYVIALRHIIR